MRHLKLVTGLISLFIGITLAIWVLYNIFIKTETVYSGPKTLLALIIGGFGFGTILTKWGWHQLMFFLGKTKDEFES
jgi:hypothetical protein